MLITSRSNPLVKRFRALRDRGADEGLCVLEGVKLVEEASAAGLTMVEAAVASRFLSTPRGAALVERLATAGVPVRADLAQLAWPALLSAQTAPTWLDAHRANAQKLIQESQSSDFAWRRLVVHGS